jgi:uncharacterized membrane protein (UPF0127 family)
LRPDDAARDLTGDIHALQSNPLHSSRRPLPRSGGDRSSGFVRSSGFAAVAVRVAGAALAAAALFAQASCSRADQGPRVVVHSATGDTSVTVELALTREAQARGLMFRTELAEGAGMLFVFEEEDERAFWMSNTPIPLDILYIRGDSTIRTIAARTTPYSEKAIPSRGPVRYVLEVPGGWAERHGVRPGDKVTLPDLGGARRAGD